MFKLFGVPRHFLSDVKNSAWSDYRMAILRPCVSGLRQTMCLLLVYYMTAILKFEGENMKSQILVNIQHRLV